MMRQAGRAGRHGLGLLVVAVMLIGLTLRGPIVGVPPLLATIRDDLAIGPATAGLLTSLPLVAFAVLSPFVAGIVSRLGVDRTILLSLLLLGAAIALRPWTGVAGLLTGTAAVGVAITIGNVVLPVLVRRDAGTHVPQVMAASVGSYGIGQTLVTVLAVPVAAVAGWRWSITLPAVLVIAALAVWMVRMWITGAWLRAAVTPSRLSSDPPADPPADLPADMGWRHVWRQRPAWWLAVFFGLQALMFYTASTWVPTQLVATTSMTALTAGTAVSVFHLIGIGGTFLVPVLLRWTGDARRGGVGVALGWFAFFAGLYLLPAGWPAWMALGGVVQGAGIGLGLTLVAVRPVDAHYGRYLSGMVQGVGYGLAAVGPVVVGWIADVTAGWAMPTIVMLGCSVVMAMAARHAGDRRPIGQ